MNHLLPDLRYAARMLWKRRATTTLAVVTLALGMAASATLFSAARAVFWNPLPYPQAERLVHIWHTAPGFVGNFSYPDYVAMVEQNRSFESVSAFEPWGAVAITGIERPRPLSPNFVTPMHLEHQGAQPLHGRLFTAEENQVHSAQPAAILSYALWRDQFGGDAGIVGKSVQLNRTPFTVVGVLRPEFVDYASSPQIARDIWLPAAMAPSLLGQGPLTSTFRIYWGLARLKPGVTLAQAQEDLNAISQRMEEKFPSSHRGFRLNVQPLQEYLLGGFRAPVTVLALGAVFILLIGCANVANLLLAQMSERRREMAVRTALGASSSRLLQQLLAESSLLAGLAGALGIAVALAGVGALRGVLLAGVSPLLVVEMDALALAVSMGLALLTAVLCGLAPALEGARVDIRESLSHSGRSGVQLGRSPLRRALVVAEVTISVVLLVGAALMLRSFNNLTNTNIGVQSENLLTFRMDLTGPQYAQPAQRIEFARAFEEKAKTQPAIESVTLFGPSVLGRATWVMFVLPQEHPSVRPEDFQMVSRHNLNPGGLRNLGVPLLRGREFTEFDNAQNPRVAVVSEALAQQFWPGQDAVGKQLKFSNPALPPLTVIGVAADVKHRTRYNLQALAQSNGPMGLQPQRDVYLPYAQRGEAALTAAVRVRGGAQAGVDAVRAALAGIDPDLAISDVMFLNDRIAQQEQQPAAIAGLTGVYAAIALLLSALGVYGVLSQAVSQRTQEFGVRMALGARVGDVLRMVVRQGMTLVTIGVVLGAIAAASLTQLLTLLLYGVSPLDGASFGVAGAVLGVVALAACLGPAWRASRVDPMTALRHE